MKKPDVKKIKKELEIVSHRYIRERDSVAVGVIAGNCCTCGKWCEGSNFQCGHYEPDSTGGALLRYHPRNMHGQGGYCCNINRHGQQRMGNEYTMFMIRKYGLDYVNRLRALKNRTIKADIIFYQTLLELYKQKDEEEIVNYLETLC